MTEKVFSVINFLMTPIQRNIPNLGSVVKIIYNGRIYKGEIHNLNASQQMINVDGKQTSVFQYFKDIGKEIAQTDGLVSCKLKDRQLYLPKSLCWN